MISPQGLLTFKKDANKLFHIIEALNNHYKFTEYQVVETLVQNIQADTSNCHGYTHQEEVERVKHAIKTIGLMASYAKHPVTSYIHEQLSITFDGIYMTEQEERVIYNK